MKKKFIAVYALIGVLALGSTALTSRVDDNESASVTAIRDAKAQQLASIAALNNAQAAAAELAAQAEADLKAAQAAYNQALANANQADADWTQEQIRQAKEEFALKIESIKAEYDAKIAEYKSNQAFWEQQAWTNAESHIKAVYEAYARALTNVNTYTQQKLEQEVKKAMAEAEVVKADEAVKQILADLNIEKAQKERELAKLQAMKEKQPSKDDYLAQLDELEKQAYDIIQNQKPKAAAEEKAAKDAFDDKKEAVTEGEYEFSTAAAALEALKEEMKTTESFTNSTDIQLAEDELEAYHKEHKDYPIEETEKEELKVTKYEQRKASELQAAVIEMDEKFETELENADQAIEKATGEEWEKDDDDRIIWGEETTSVNGAKGAVAYQEQSIADKQKEMDEKNKQIEQATKDEAAPAVIEGLNNEYKALEGEKKELEKKLKTLKNNVTAAEETLAEKEDDKAELVEKQTAYKANVEIIKNAEKQKVYDDAFASLETLAVTYVEKAEAVKPYDDALEEIGISAAKDGKLDTTSGHGEYQYIKGLLDGIYDVQNLIDECNTRLTQIKTQIELGGLNNLVSLQTVKVQVYNPITGQLETVEAQYYVLNGNGTITPEDAVAMIDAQIKVLEERIRIETEKANNYKAELDALLGSEETPAA